MEYYSLFILVGIFAGVFSGLLGISGGIITVPALFAIFHYLQASGKVHLPTDSIMHFAIGTSMAAMVFSSLSSLWFHQRKKTVVWKLVIVLLPALVVGAVTGSLVATYLSGRVLKVIFGAFAFCLGIYFFMPLKLVKEDHPLPSNTLLTLLGFFTAALANILGIGGGIFIAPFLMHHKLSTRSAIATSAATGFFITLLGSISYIYLGSSKVGETKVGEIGTWGYIYLPAFFILSIVTFCTAPVGVALAHKLPSKVVRGIFSIALLAVGMLMVWR